MGVSKHEGFSTLLDRRTDGRGQPTKLTKGRHDKIVANVAAAGRLGLAARAAGVGQSTAHLWMKRGIDYAEHLMNGGAPSERELRYLEFASDVAKAEATYEMSVIGRIREIGAPHDVSVIKITERIDAEGNTNVSTETTTRRQDDWRALAYCLEKRFPDEYGEVTRTEHSGPGGGPLEVQSVAVHVDVVEERDARIEQILGALADTRGGPRAAAIALGRGQAARREVIDAASHEVPPPHTNGSSNGISAP